MLRKSCGCDEIFISSLARCTTWDTAGGKSGSIFLKTKGKSKLFYFSEGLSNLYITFIDERFLIKQISKYEMDAFLGSANKYFLYMFNEVFDKGVSIYDSKALKIYTDAFQ
jgi:1-phosphatidylinositol-3-phosphate 5-kinase